MKAEPNPGRSIVHDFDCTHDPCVCDEVFSFPEGESHVDDPVPEDGL